MHIFGDSWEELSRFENPSLLVELYNRECTYHTVYCPKFWWALHKNSSPLQSIVLARHLLYATNDEWTWREATLPIINCKKKTFSIYVLLQTHHLSFLDMNIDDHLEQLLYDYKTWKKGLLWFVDIKKKVEGRKLRFGKLDCIFGTWKWKQVWNGQTLFL